MYRYQLRSTNYSSARYGLCEVCGEHASEVFSQAVGPQGDDWASHLAQSAPTITDEWVEFMSDPDNLTSVLARLSLTMLPEGVNSDDPRVIQTQELIKLANPRKET